MKNETSQSAMIPLSLYYSDGKRISRIFYYFNWAILLAQIMGIFVVLSNNDILIAQIIAASIVPVLIGFISIYQQKFELTAIFLALVLFVMLTIVATFGLGIHHISNVAFPVILIVASLVTEKRTMVFLTLFAIACVAWLVFGEIFEVYTPAPLVHSVPGDFFSMAIIITMTALMVRLITETMFNSMLQLRKELAERKQIEEQLKNDITLRLKAEEQVRQFNVELEKRVQERTAELETSVRELESFSYSVSHDLRAPLRAIAGYSNILVNQHQAALDVEGRQMLETILTSSKHMSKLIDALLNFSRLSRHALTKVNLNLNNIVKGMLKSYAPETTSRQIEWVIGDLPPTYGDLILIQQVFANLIGNAVKYTFGRNPAQIELGSFKKDDQIIYFIRDNGAGFDMKHSDKLFGVFQRLHSESEFEGTGIGLAIVQRIIHRHGGKIWAEAEPGKGATFYFTLA